MGVPSEVTSLVLTMTTRPVLAVRSVRKFTLVPVTISSGMRGDDRALGMKFRVLVQCSPLRRMARILRPNRNILRSWARVAWFVVPLAKQFAYRAPIPPRVHRRFWLDSWRRVPLQETPNSGDIANIVWNVVDNSLSTTFKNRQCGIVFAQSLCSISQWK